MPKNKQPEKATVEFTFLERLTKTLHYAGMKDVKIERDKEYDGDFEVYILDNTWVFGVMTYPETKTPFFVQVIVTHPGNREEPPSEDYVDVCQPCKFPDAIQALFKAIAEQALSDVGEEQLERHMEEDEKKLAQLEDDENGHYGGFMV